MKENRSIIITEVIIAFILLTGIADLATADELETIQITNMAFEEQQPSIIFADNHFYIAYNSNEKGNNDIFIKKYDSNGNFIEEKQITTNSSGQYSPSIAFENNTKTLYVAYDSVETGNYDIFINVYDLALNPVGEKKQITNNKEKSNQEWPSIIFANEYLYIAYASNERENYDIFIEKYDLDWNQIKKEQMSDGGGWDPSITHIENTLYIAYKNSSETPTDIIIGTYYLNNLSYINMTQIGYEVNCTTIDILSKDNNLYVTFDLEKGGDYDIFITLYDSNLTHIGGFIRITDSVDGEVYPSLALANGSLCVAYTSYETGNGDIYTTKKFVARTFIPPNTNIIFVGRDNNFYVVYDSYETGNWDIFVEKYDLNLNSIEKKQLTGESSRQVEPFITFIENNFYVAYASWKNETWDIIIEKYDFDWNVIEKRKEETCKKYKQGHPSIVRAGNNYYLAYHAYKTEYSDIFINRYDLDWELIEKKPITNPDYNQYNPSIIFAKNNFYVVYDESDYNIIVVEKLDFDLNFITRVNINSEYYLKNPSITFANNYLYVTYQSTEIGDWSIFAREYDLELNLIGEKKVTDWDHRNHEHPSIAVVNDTLYLAYSSDVSGDYAVDITSVTLSLPPPPPKPPIDGTPLIVLLMIACFLVFSGALIYKKRDEFMTSRRYRYFVLVVAGIILVYSLASLTYPDGEEFIIIFVGLLPPTYALLIGIISKSARDSFTFASFAFLCSFFGLLLCGWLAYEMYDEDIPIIFGLGLGVYFALVVYSVAAQHLMGWLKEKVRLKITKFKPIPNPYIAGVPIRGKEMFFGRNDVFDFLKQRFITETAKPNIFLYGGRRIGKTSALYQIKGGALGDKFIPVFIDLQGIGDMDTYGFFDFVTQEIRKTLEGKGIKMKEYAFDNAKESYTATFNQVLDDISNLIKDKQIILMFDETEIIEGMIRKGKFDSAIYSYYESIIQHKPKVSCLFTGSPGALSKKEEGKPLFRAANYQKVTFLVKEDATELIKKPVEGFAQYNDKIIERILRITGCHPFYIQYICYEIVNVLNKGKRNNVEMKDIDLVINKLIKGAPMHLGYVWDQASYDEKIVLSLVSEIIGKEDEFVSTLDIEKYKNEKEKKGETTIKLSERVEKILEDLHREDILEKDSKNRYRYKVDLIRYWVKGYYSVWRVIGEEEHESVSE